MKKYKALTALLLSLSVFLSSAYAAPSYSDAETYRLEPKVSEGISFSESFEGSLEILAHEDGDELIFDETKELSFTLQYSAGWLACDRYSSFFPGDDRACVTALGGGLYLCVFSAAEGGSVSKEEWGSAVFNASVSELPKLYIDASVPFDEIDRENWVDADFSLTLGTKEFESGEYEGTGKVKGRGNSSWTYPKKPYSIKLSSKASLLDIPKTKKYAVVPSYWDGSLMRNYITYKVWQGLRSQMRICRRLSERRIQRHLYTRREGRYRVEQDRHRGGGRGRSHRRLPHREGYQRQIRLRDRSLVQLPVLGEHSAGLFCDKGA